MFKLIFICFWLLVSLTTATSYGRSKPLSYVSSVEDIRINTPNQRPPKDEHKFSITLKIPSSRRYHNLQRRWWAMSDPNNQWQLNNLHLADQSEPMYDYLMRNSSMELPEDLQEYRFVLEPHQDHDSSQAEVYTSDEHGNVVPHPDFVGWKSKSRAYHGRAYRRYGEYHVTDGSVKRKFKPVGWARVSLHEREDGTFKVMGAWKVDDFSLGVQPAIYHLDWLETFERTLHKEELHLLDGIKSRQVVWRDVDMRKHQDHTYEIPDDDYQFLQKRTVVSKSGDENDSGDTGVSAGVNLANTVGDKDGCPKHREIALIGVAADCNYVGEFNSTSDVREHIINNVNTASEQYEKSFNITLGLSAIYIVNDTNCPKSSSDSKEKWNYACEGSSSDAINDRLSYFSEWRGEGNRTGDGLATWTLFTHCDQGSVVGLSWQGMLCTSNAQKSGNDTYTAGANVITKTSLDWRVMAHEIGHTFGAVHDCTEGTCKEGKDKQSQCCPLSKDKCNAGGKYIMNPASTDSQDGFSDCTQGNVCQGMKRNSVNSTCLTSNTGVHLVTKNECGNGIVEDGEDCDCGGEEGCKDNNCCDPKTCKFKDNAVCDDSNEDCCHNCQYASKDTVCRSSQGPCDPEEKCSGKSAKCPPNKQSKNGDKCTNPDHKDKKGLTCISGHCTSRDLQCLTLLANTTIEINGKKANATKACKDDTSCQLSCVDPSMGDSRCFTTGQNFLDGTPCQGKGKCKRGRCVDGSGDNPFNSNNNGVFSASWLERHKNVIIGVAAGVGGLIVLAVLWGFIRRCLVAKGMVKPNVKPPMPGPPAPGPPPTYQQYQNPFANPQGSYPRPPPPSYEMTNMRRY